MAGQPLSSQILPKMGKCPPKKNGRTFGRTFRRTFGRIGRTL